VSLLHTLLLAVGGLVVIVAGEGLIACLCVVRHSKRIAREIRETTPPDVPRRRRTRPARELVRR
jgi:hypothetical protein